MFQAPPMQVVMVLCWHKLIRTQKHQYVHVQYNSIANTSQKSIHLPPFLMHCDGTVAV